MCRRRKISLGGKSFIGSFKRNFNANEVSTKFSEIRRMAKAKKKSRNAGARAKGPEYKGAHGNEKDEKLRVQKIVPAMEKLVSSEMSDRSMAIAAINTMCDDPKLRTLLLKEKLLKVVLEQSIKDSNEEIASEAYGLLRNLCIEEGYDVAIFLWRQGILKAIEDALTKSTKAFEAVANGASSDTKFTKQQVATVFDFTENVIGLTSALAATNEDIFTGISNKLVPGLGQFLTAVIEFARSTVAANSSIAVSASLFTAVCEILYALSEDNAPFIDSVSAYPFDDILSEFAAGKTHYPSPSLVYVNGLKYNTLLQQLTSKPKNNDLNDINANSTLLDIQKSLIAVIKSIDIAQARKDSEPIASDASMEEVNTQFTKNIQARSLIESVQVAIEILTALAETITIDPAEFAALTAAAEASHSDDDETMGEGKDDDDEFYIKKHVEKEEDYIDESVFDREEDNVTDDSMSPVLSFMLDESMPLVAQLLPFGEFQSRAMAALNNMAWTMHTQAPNSAKWRTNAQELWTNILPHVTATDQTAYKEIEVLCSAVGVLWAVASTYKGEVPVSVEAVNYLISQTTDLAKVFPVEECTDYCVKTVGLLAQLAKASGRHEVTLNITKFYFDTLATAPSTAVKDTTPLLSPKVIVDVIYAVFEVFGDKSYEYDQTLYVDGGLNGKLATSVIPLRKFFKRIDKTRDPLLRERASECVQNLVRFVEYKKAERN